MACSNKSEYLVKLECENKDIAVRYMEKIKVIQSIDPFTLGGTPDDPQETCSFPPVDAIDIVSYMVLTHKFYTNEQMKAYKRSAAYQYFKAGFVQDGQAYKIGEHTVVLSQVQHSETSRNPPLKLWIIFQTDGSVISAHCTCMAELVEVCSHIGAVLYELECMHNSPRNLSSTDVVPIKVSDMDFGIESQEKPSTSEPNSTDKIPAIEGDELVQFLQKIKDSGNECVLMRIVEPFASEIASKIHKNANK